MRNVYHFYADPSHAWLKVTRSEIDSLGIADKISHHSYVNGENVFLEEDIDAGVFLDAVKAIKGDDWKPVFKEHFTNNSSKIRNYWRF